MQTLREFMTRRKAEIDEEIAQLRAELRQITAAEGMGEAEARAQQQRQRQWRPETIKEQIVKILTDNPKGLEATEIQDQLQNRFSRNVKRESLSPQLSRLGRSGTIVHEGKRWVLPTVETALSRYGAAVSKKIEANLLGELPQEAENPQEFHS